MIIQLVQFEGVRMEELLGGEQFEKFFVIKEESDVV